MFAGEPPASLKELAERYGKLFAEVDALWQQTLKSAPADSPSTPPPAALADADAEAIRQVLYAADAPANLPAGDIPRLFDVPTAQKSRALQRKVEELDATHPGAPPRAMALQDNAAPVTPRVFLRGNPHNPGPEVPRRFLEVVAGAQRKPFQHGSGRLELAEAIASPDNPLTARVIVNRVWMHHFGAPLVRTPSDFGLRSEPPTHPELLDYLAAWFIEEGWSLKKLHRLMLLSSAYQQSSAHHARFAARDPANQWLWRMNRRRLDLEAMRDTLLALSGQLDLTLGGRAVEITTEPFATRRTVYGFVERQNLPGLFRTFDFANPDSTSPQRFHTTVPQQALFLMNSPFVIEQARHLAGRPELAACATDRSRVQALYRLTYQRPPRREEVDLACGFVAQQQACPVKQPEAPAWHYGYGEFDENTSRVKAFTPLPHFTGEAWQGGGKLPDDQLGWVMLDARGGHVGNDRQHAAIRRWVAPRGGTISIRGELKHESERGDGVRGRIVSSRLGQVLVHTAHNGTAAMRVEGLEVQRGDTIDFVVDCRGSVEFDSFLWAPKITLHAADDGLAGGSTGEWDARADFSGPAKVFQPLDAWEKYAQVLLLSNELMFVD
jgi:hypothetical protein